MPPWHSLPDSRSGGTSPVSDTLPKTWTGRLGPQVPAQPAAGDFGANANQLYVLRIPLDVAQSYKRYAAAGNCLYVIDASSPTALAYVRITTDGAELPLRQGFAARLPAFKDLSVRNTAQAGQWIDVLYYVASFDFFVLNPGAQISTVDLTKATSGENINGTIPAGFAGIVVPVVIADSNRRRTILSNDGPGRIRVGWHVPPATTSISATVGQLIPPGASITLEGTGGIDVWLLDALDTIVGITTTGD